MEMRNFFEKIKPREDKDKTVRRIEDLIVRKDGGDLTVVPNVKRKEGLSLNEEKELEELREKQPERTKEELIELMDLYADYKEGNYENIKRLKELYYGRKPRVYLEPHGRYEEGEGEDHSRS